MIKIGLLGWFGCGNAGDEAMIYSIVPTFLKIKNTEISIFTREPTITKKFLGENSQIKIIKQKFWNPFLIIELLDFAQKVRKLDVLVIGGGGLIRSYGHRKIKPESFMNQWILRALIGKIFRKKVMFFGIGAGPIYGLIDRKVMKFVLNHIDCITVRDEKSKEYLKKYGIKKKIYVTADPVFLLNKMTKNNIKKDIHSNFSKKGKIIVGICPRKLYNFSDPSGEKQKKLVDTLVLASKHLIEKHNANILLISLKPQNYDEREMINEISNKIGNSEHIFLVLNLLNPVEHLDVISQLDLLVGIKFHSLVFASQSGVPMIGISYDPKITSFFRYMDMKKYLFYPDSLETSPFLKKIDDIVDNEKKVREKVILRNRKIQDRAKQNFVIFKKFILGSVS